MSGEDLLVVSSCNVIFASSRGIIEIASGTAAIIAAMALLFGEPSVSDIPVSSRGVENMISIHILQQVAEYYRVLRI